MLQDFPACAGLCQNSNIGFCFVDENENKFGGGKGTGNKNMHNFFQDHIMEKEK